MSEHLLFLTGKLAEKSLHRVLRQMQPLEFSFEIVQLGISVAALMTADMIKRRLQLRAGVTRVILPGRCRGDIDVLSEHFSTPFERGPEELKDLPAYFDKDAVQRELDQYDVKIFAEIVDAPRMGIEAIVQQARHYRGEGADVIDIGSLPDTPFAHLEETVTTLKQEGFQVSVDSMRADDLIKGGQAGADYLLSLKESTLWICDEVDSVPVLIANHATELKSLYRAMEKMEEKGHSYFADPILEPIHFGFTDSILRYHALRQRFPTAAMLMGVGNLTELTHADTLGINALLMGIISELKITALLTTEVSRHCRTAVREADLARRIMYAAREDNIPPRHIDEGLLAVHERQPYPYEMDEIKEFASDIKDKNFRIQVTEEGIHIYNRDGLYSANDPYDLFDPLGVEDDGPHAFYLGLELARAQIAWQLGKRYQQDQALTWGCLSNQQTEDLSRFAEERSTLKARTLKAQSLKAKSKRSKARRNPSGDN